MIRMTVIAATLCSPQPASRRRNPNVRQGHRRRNGTPENLHVGFDGAVTRR
jgi:hypothetical protein